MGPRVAILMVSYVADVKIRQFFTKKKWTKVFSFFSHSTGTTYEKNEN
jgi:hypothetical protein